MDENRAPRILKIPMLRRLRSGALRARVTPPVSGRPNLRFMHQTEKQGRGCLFYGIITLIVVIVALFIGTYFGARHAFKSVVASYTDTKPAEIPGLTLSETEQAERMEALRERVSQAQLTGGELTLDETDLNLVLSRTPEVKDFADRIHFQIQTNQLTARVSLPLDRFEAWKKITRRFGSKDLTGRYLNATIVMEPSVQNQRLQLLVTDIKVRGASLPETFTGKVQLENIVEEASKDPDARTVLNRLEGVQVEGGKLRLDFKADPDTKSI